MTLSHLGPSKAAADHRRRRTFDPDPVLLIANRSAVAWKFAPMLVGVDLVADRRRAEDGDAVLAVAGDDVAGVGRADGVRPDRSVITTPLSAVSDRAHAAVVRADQVVEDGVVRGRRSGNRHAVLSVARDEIPGGHGACRR